MYKIPKHLQLALIFYINYSVDLTKYRLIGTDNKIKFLSNEQLRNRFFLI